VLDKHVELLERALVHQELEPLARRELAPLVLCSDAVGSPSRSRPFTALLEFFQDFLHRLLQPRYGRNSIARMVVWE